MACRGGWRRLSRANGGQSRKPEDAEQSFVHRDFIKSALERNVAQPQRVGDDRDGTQAHRRARDDGAEQNAEKGIEQPAAMGMPSAL